MRSKFLILPSILLVAGVCAQQPKPYLTGKLVEMDSMRCSAYNKDVRNNREETTNAVAAPIETLCPEYELRADEATYRIVSSNAKHPAPLPIGESALYRWQKGKMLVRVPAFDSEEREYIVVSKTTRDPNTADASATRLHHLQ